MSLLRVVKSSLSHITAYFIRSVWRPNDFLSSSYKSVIFKGGSLVSERGARDARRHAQAVHLNVLALSFVHKLFEDDRTLAIQVGHEGLVKLIVSLFVLPLMLL